MLELSFPTGTVTFLLTDVEGSTRLWEEHPSEMRAALEHHDTIVRSAIQSHGGYVFSRAGDAFAASFARVADALAAARLAQERLAAENWPEGAEIRVRMGLHTGEADERDGDYFGPTVNRAARIMATAHGGQAVVSDVTARLAGSELLDLGEHRLKDLSAPERLWQLGSEVFPPLRSLDAVRHNLPIQRTELVGRIDEVARVGELLSSDRLVTLTGIGGVGKTRLALAAAAELSSRFPDGVFFVDLSPLTEGRLVALAVGEAVGVSLDAASAAGRSAVAQIARVLAYRRLLLVMDNCEHLLDDVAELVDELVSSGNNARVLATSREPLELEGERTYRVPSLPATTEGADGPALRLLIDRARAADDAFAPTAADRPALIDICEHVDGIPLAIELAAVQLRHLTPKELADKLDDRFRMLVGGRRRRRHRQQTLQAMMDWSWALLQDDERRLLAELSVFAGGWTLPAAQGICAHDGGDVAALLGSLVAKSLVVVDHNQWGSRYRLLETVRLYGQLKLAERGDADHLRTAHANWYAAWMDDWNFEQQWASAELASRLRADFDNLRGAVEWLTDHGDTNRLATVVRGCTFLCRENVAVQEALDWTSRVDIDALSGADRARALLVRADAEYVNGDYDGMRNRATEAYHAAAAVGADDVAAAALTIMSQGLAIPEPDRAARLLEEAIQRARKAGANRIEATALSLLAFAGSQLGWPHEQQLVLAEQAVERCGPDGWDRNGAEQTLALIHLRAGRPEQLVATARRLAESSDGIGLPLEAARHWIDVAWAAAEAGDEAAWRQGVQASYQRYRDAGGRRGLPDVLLSIAMWEACNGDPCLASALLATVSTTLLNDQGSYEVYGRCRNRIRAARLRPDLIDAARQRGRTTTVEAALTAHTSRIGLTPGGQWAR